MADADASNQDCRLTARSRLLGVFFLFAVIACLRFSVIATPPHWDAILGPFPEAIWLKNHGFDYSALIHKELRYEKGGPVTYGWSVVPTVYAVLLTLFPPQVVFAILHLANFFLAAVIAVTLYGLLRDLLRLERLLAIGKNVALSKGMSAEVKGGLFLHALRRLAVGRVHLLGGTAPTPAVDVARPLAPGARLRPPGPAARAAARALRARHGRRPQEHHRPRLRGRGGDDPFHRPPFQTF